MHFSYQNSLFPTTSRSFWFGNLKLLEEIYENDQNWRMQFVCWRRKISKICERNQKDLINYFSELTIIFQNRLFQRKIDIKSRKI